MCTQILLHEITKLLKYAGATDVLYMRIGTSGGVGLEGGTIVVSNQSVTTTEVSWHLGSLLAFTHGSS